MKTERLIAGLVAGGVALSLAACGGNDSGDGTAQLQEAMRQAHQYDSAYELLGTITYTDGAVTVDAQPWADPWSGAQTYCGWVSAWLYDRDGADATVTVNVPARLAGPDAKLVRRGESEDCSEAAYHSQYGA